jgi:hypothetical protein
MAAACCLALAGCGGGSPAATSTPTPLPTFSPPDTAVEYQLDGTATQADITIARPTGTSQQQKIDVPMRTEDGELGLRFDGFQSGSFLFISAQNSNDDGGTLICRIKVGAELISETKPGDPRTSGPGFGVEVHPEAFGLARHDNADSYRSGGRR